ncbi:MAG: alpha-amylase family glycosyl hydrolase, partial [Planctomycetes bacterium]|nr:alpha-amylase family glycosyl hydrolase [Planctomycetota bacterium]
MSRRLCLAHLCLFVGVSSLPLFAQGTTHGQKSPTTPVGWVFDHYQLTVSDWNPRLRIELTPRVGSTADLYVRRGQAPTLQDWDIREATPHTSAEFTIVDQSSTPALTTDVWHIGVWRDRNTTYSISYRLEPDVSSRSGFGAVPWADSSGRGTTFRTFAPNATRAWVTGSFNGWSQSTAEMGDEPNGNWSLDVRNVRAGAEYQFVFETSQGFITRRDSHARRLTHSSGNGVVVDHEDYVWQNSFTMPAWNDLVIYEMHLGTFNDVAGGLPGTLTTAGQRLDYLKDLGVNAIELMPFCEFPGEFSWGYNYSYPWAVESHYGSPEILKAFVDAAHARGIAVFCDLVFNHWGPTEMDLWQYDGWSSGPQYGGIYFYNDWRSQTPWGDTRPDYTRREVRTYIRDNVLSWLEDYRFDGIRFDSTSYMRFANGAALPEAWSLFQWLNYEINVRQGWKFSVAEDMWSNDWITRGTGSGGAGFDSQWDPNFVHPMRDAMVAQSDGQRDMGAVRDAIT